MVSVRFPDFLFCDVFSDALEYLFGFCRSAGLKTSRNTALDIQITLELGISRDTIPSGRCTVCLYSVMLTSTVLGLITMVLYKPRSWCVYCPMGTMTQLICKVKDKKDG